MIDKILACRRSFTLGTATIFAMERCMCCGAFDHVRMTAVNMNSDPNIVSSSSYRCSLCKEVFNAEVRMATGSLRTYVKFTQPK